MSSTSQISTPATADLLQTPHSFDTSITQNSIRNSARLTSRSTGVQVNVTNTNSMFNINYRHLQRKSTETTGTNANASNIDTHDASASHPVDNRDAFLDTIMPQELTHAPHSPIQVMQQLINDSHDRIGTFDSNNAIQNTSVT